jgi:hypothetical protein
MRKLFIGILFGAALLATVGCSRPEKAVQILRAHGYTQIQTHGVAWTGGCSKGDHFSTKFTALTPVGQPVSGVVCEGLLKGATIRIY